MRGGGDGFNFGGASRSPNAPRRYRVLVNFGVDLVWILVWIWCGFGVDFGVDFGGHQSKKVPLVGLEPTTPNL